MRESRGARSRVAQRLGVCSRCVERGEGMPCVQSVLRPPETSRSRGRGASNLTGWGGNRGSLDPSRDCTLQDPFEVKPGGRQGAILVDSRQHLESGLLIVRHRKCWLPQRKGRSRGIPMRDIGVGDRLDQYEVTDVLARGAMGSVFKAIDSASGEVVVLKIPHIQYESDVVFFERFRREEEILQQLDHPNIVRVLKSSEKSRLYIAMEFVEGRSLASMLKRGRPLSIEQALAIAQQVCSALTCLHARCIVHPDLKPENIYLTSSGQVKILDFGIALLESARRLTWAGLSAVLGTPDYMAPEQIRGRRGDARTDIYAVGTLLYEMLTGEMPYDRAHPMALLRTKADEEPRPPSYHIRAFDRDLEAIILKAIERDPRDRYANAVELLEDLIHPSAVGTRAPDTKRRRGRPGMPIRAARRAATAAVVVVVAGLGTLVLVSHGRSAAPDRGTTVSVRDARR